MVETQWEMPWNDSGRSVALLACKVHNFQQWEKFIRKEKKRRRAERCEAPLIVRLVDGLDSVKERFLRSALWTTINNLSALGWSARGWRSRNVITQNYYREKNCSSSDNVKYGERGELSNAVDLRLMVENFVEQERSAQQSRSVDLAFFSLFFCATVLITSRATEREAQNRLESFYIFIFGECRRHQRPYIIGCFDDCANDDLLNWRCNWKNYSTKCLLNEIGLDWRLNFSRKKVLGCELILSLRCSFPKFEASDN